jgi:hypothetical protein
MNLKIFIYKINLINVFDLIDGLLRKPLLKVNENE